MSQADVLYNQLIEDVIVQGVSDAGMMVRPKWKDGTPAYSKSVIGRSLRFDNSEIAILTNKEVKWKAAIIEAVIWIWQMKSNVVQDLRDLGSNIWNEWEIIDDSSKWNGTIGAAYGYQLAKRNQRTPYTDELKDLFKSGFISGFHTEWDEENHEHWAYLDQVDYLLYQLKTNPSSRRHITMLWNPDDIQEMSLTPCVYETQWHVKENKLYLEVRARSNDLGLGHPFNVFQYNVLQRVFAQVLGYELGDYIFHIGDAHIYDRHIDVLAEQLGAETYEAPTLWINPEKKNFYDFTINDFKLENYQHGPFRRMEVAI
jgi:thymidylate synthase